MLERLQIRNYRAFRDLEMPRLSRVNLVAGRNNAGKTSLLEAIFLLAGAGRPGLALSTDILRTMQGSEEQVTRESLVETLWKPLFLGFDTGRTIEISAEHEPFGRLSLKISLEALNTVELPLKDARRTDLTTPDELVFTFQQGDEDEISTAAQLGTDGIKFTHHQRKIPFLVGLQSARERTDRADAIRLGSLRKRKQGDVVLEALRVIEPRLRSIEENSASGFPMIWGDIGLSELVPLAVMGEGITRFASIVLTMVEVPGGVMLIDEVENGIHHSVLTDVWRMIDDASRRFGVQVFATTHSFECVHAADQAIQTDDLALHRLEIEDDRCRCVTYERPVVAAAIRHNIEVR